MSFNIRQIRKTASNFREVLSAKRGNLSVCLLSMNAKVMTRYIALHTCNTNLSVCIFQ